MDQGEPVALGARLEKFVEAHLGALTSATQAQSGASRITWFVTGAQGRAVLRVDSGDGPVAGTDLSLQREAAAYRALDGKCRIPRLLAETAGALLIEQVPGVDHLSALDAAGTATVMNDYVDALAELHRVEVTGAFEELNPPSIPAAAATSNLDLWTRIFSQRVRRPCPLAVLASQWLAEHAPTNAERLVVCHGDVGPGNFLHDGTRVTGLLDWEFVHVGDPMDDLAWLAFRGHHLGNVGDFNEQLARWQSRTGLALDLRRIGYYRIMVMYIWLVSCLAALDNGARSQDRFTYLSLVTLMNVILPRAMLEYEGKPILDVDVDIVRVESELAEQVLALVDLTALKWPAADADDKAYVTMMGSQVHHLMLAHADIARQNQAAVSTLLGKTVTAEEMDGVLVEHIRAHPRGRAAVMHLLHENGCRRISANELLLPMAEKPLLPLTE